MRTIVQIERAIGRYLQGHLPEVFAWLEAYLLQEEPLAIAVSGGSDSMLLAVVMLSFWKKKNRNLSQLFFFHCNHKVRHASDEEEKRIKKVFDGLALSVFTKCKLGRTDEAGLRARRYLQFLHSMQEKGIEKIVFGHHLNDRIEGSFLNLARGCGKNGFLGMQKVQPHHLLEGKQVMRPLLSVKKEDILSFCTNFGIEYVEDESNADAGVSLRNAFRNQIFPFLKNLGQGNFEQSMENLYAELELQTSQKQVLEPLKFSPYWKCKKAFVWKVPNLKAVSEEMFAELIRELGLVFRERELRDLLRRIRRGDAGFRQVQGWIMMVSYGELLLFESGEVFWEEEVVLKKQVIEKGIQTFGLFQLEVDADLVGATLRFARVGDVFQGKSFGKRCNNHKIPIFWRRSLPLAERGGKVIVVWRPNQLIF